MDASIKAETSTYTVDLDIPGGPTITAGSAPFPDEEYMVTGLRIAYTDRQVTQIRYTADREDVSVHPDYLGKPDAWPSWVRVLVDRHRPADRAVGDAGLSGASGGYAVACPECGLGEARCSVCGTEIH